ncbi:MAG: farnesyl diphosphate synthase [Pseudomonadota bacterium]
MTTDWARMLARFRAQSEAALDARLPAADSVPTRLHAAIRYATLGGGKRIRPALVYATGELLGVATEPLDAAAAAVEMIHAYSLIHDDLPAMDDDDWRRGRATCHRAFDEATAILAGDALQVLAFESLAAAPVDAQARIAMVHVLARASGTQGMAGGQALDLGYIGQILSAAQVEQMHRYKTGALLKGSVMLAVVLAGLQGTDQAAALTRYARAMGFAFQIVDDLLDIEGDPTLLGKTIGADSARSKPTYPAAVGLDNARQKALALMIEADAALEAFGEAGQPLRWLGHYIVHRQS